jgi:amino acid adenylation domain-containing protein
MNMSLIQQAVTVQAHARPEATALVDRTQVMTYDELERASNQLARTLKQFGCQRGDRVCLLMPKSIPAIVAILAVLKADCIYVPLDPMSPPARVATTLARAESGVILASGPVGSLLDAMMAEKQPSSGAPIIGWMGGEHIGRTTWTPAFTQADCARVSDRALNYGNGPDDPAYILFTSGSTGTPKGVVITHANVMHFIQWATDYFGFTSSDRISAHPPLHFDLSVFDLFGTLSAGAALHLVPHELNLLPHALAEFIRTSKLTHWFSVPSVLNYMAKFDVLKPDDFPCLKRVLWCGEVFPTSGLVYWMKRLPHVAFTNLYGPTEATIASSYYTVPTCPDDDKAPIPIGTACPGEELLVLDEGLRPVPHGVVGGLYIRGVGLSPGYWQEPEKTAAAFLRHPGLGDGVDRVYKTGDLAKVGEDGLVYFHGRSDTQVKIRGYRIELGEIEAALQTIPVLQESAVVVIESEGFEAAVIACAYVPAGEGAVSASDVKKELGKRVPSYMWPSLWHCMDKLPRNASGKVDRPHLRAFFSQHKKTAR